MPGQANSATARTINTTTDSVQGQASLTIPTGIVVQAGLGFVGGNLNYLSLGASNLNLAIGATGAFLQRYPRFP